MKTDFFIPMIDALKNINQDKILLEIVEPVDVIKGVRGFPKHRRFSTKKYFRIKQEEKRLSVKTSENAIQILQETGFIGCGETSSDFSEKYKTELFKKYDNC
ncbi:MAG: hypothetical protein HC887_08910 [Desulfobacteraceae bacterium]|nr:hypothetical protein [Desulfobacteraceae bacterium]